MDKIKAKSSDELISPYLRRPLRSFADALAEREASRIVAAKAARARLIASQSHNPDASERLLA